MSIKRSLRLPVVLGVGLGLVLAACSADGDVPDQGPATPTAAGALGGDLVVFAAASLTGTFTEIGDAFMAEHPDVTVTFSFGASSTLAQQITAGAPADLFAAASPTTMAVVVDAGATAGEPLVFARNRLEIAVPAGNPGEVTGLADLADDELTIALCAEEVPCGAAAAEAFATAGISPAPDTLEQDVKAALTKVELGEVDAALVYRTDVIAAADAVEGIDFPESAATVTDYPISLLAGAQHPEAARAFLAYVRSDAGLAVLADAGFDPA